MSFEIVAHPTENESVELYTTNKKSDEKRSQLTQATVCIHLKVRKRTVQHQILPFHPSIHPSINHKVIFLIPPDIFRIFNKYLLSFLVIFLVSFSTFVPAVLFFLNQGLPCRVISPGFFALRQANRVTLA